MATEICLGVALQIVEPPLELIFREGMILSFFSHLGRFLAQLNVVNHGHIFPFFVSAHRRKVSV